MKTDTLIDVALLVCLVIFILTTMHYYLRFGEKAWPVFTVLMCFVSFVFGTRLGEAKVRKKYEVDKHGRNKNARTNG